MLYLVQPFSQLKWADIPASTIAIARERPDVDLARLEWQDANEKTFSPDVVRIAVRHGVPCTDGIVVEAIHLIGLTRADDIRRISEQAQASRDAAVDSPSGQTMEQIFPGWAKHGRQLDERIAESTSRVIREAEQDGAELLAAPVRQELVEHWRSLGGHVPDPL